MEPRSLASILTRSLPPAKRDYGFFDISESECLLDRLTQSDFADMPIVREKDQKVLFDEAISPEQG